MPPEAAVDLAALQTLPTGMVAPWVSGLNVPVPAATPGEVALALPTAPRPVHGGGVRCGQTRVAAADTAMIPALVNQAGALTPMTMVQWQTCFLRPLSVNPDAQSGQARVAARVLRPVMSRVFGETDVRNLGDSSAAHATPSCTLL